MGEDFRVREQHVQKSCDRREHEEFGKLKEASVAETESRAAVGVIEVEWVGRTGARPCRAYYRWWQGMVLCPESTRKLEETSKQRGNMT